MLLLKPVYLKNCAVLSSIFVLLYFFLSFVICFFVLIFNNKEINKKQLYCDLHFYHEKTFFK